MRQRYSQAGLLPVSCVYNTLHVLIVVVAAAAVMAFNQSP